jgi:hypothetical protein
MDYFTEIRHIVEQASPFLPLVRQAGENSFTESIWFDSGVPGLIVLGDKTGGASRRLKTAGLPVAELAAEEEVHPSACCLFLRRKTASVKEDALGLLGWNDTYYKPSPLAATLATGVLGAGLGYGGASLAGLFLPDNWNKKRLRRNALLIGAGLGAAPGTLEMLKSLALNQPVTDGSFMTRDFKEKRAEFPALGSQTINTDQLMTTIWTNPRVAADLSEREKNLATGALQATSLISRSPYVTPSDMARLTAGMGVGYLSGLVAGKTLGALVGLPVSAQTMLANTGALRRCCQIGNSSHVRFALNFS